MLSMKWRVIVFGIFLVADLIALAAWEASPSGITYPPPNVISATWYGWLLVLAIPAMLVWVSAGAESERGNIIGIITSVAVTAVCLLFIYMAIDSASGRGCF